MRRCCSSLFFCMLAVSMGLVLLPDSQGQGSSVPSGAAVKKPSAKKPEASPKREAAAAAPACNGGELVSLHYLTATDAEALGNALAGEFDWLRLSAVKDKNKICVIALPGDRLARANDLAAARSVAVEFDRPVFSGQDGLAAYLVSLPRIGSERIARAFAESNPDLRLRPVPPFLVIVPKATPSDKIKEAAENLKHDFEGLDRIYPQDQPPALTDDCPPSDLEHVNLKKVEGWLQRHTVLLSSLHVRSVVLRLEPPPTGFVFHAWPVSNRSALSIVPGLWTAHPCFAPALALQQQLLFSQAEEQNAPKKNNQPPKNQSAGPDDAAAAGATPASQQAANKAGQARLAKSKTPPGAPKTPADKTKKADESKKKDATSDSSDSKPDTADDPPADTAANDAPAKASSMGEFVRLYHFRQAGDLATILNDSNGVQVKAVGSNPDVLLISGGTPDDRDSMRRLIARLDLPRPQLSLQVWSYQASSKEKDDAKRAGAVQDAFKELRGQVDVVNNAITASLDKGVAALASSEQDQDQDFTTYLTSRYKDCVGQDRYCLGFYDALVQPNQTKDAKASLTRLLLLLAAVKDDLSSNAVNNVIKAMEFPESRKSPADRCAVKAKKRDTPEKADSSQPQGTSLDFCNLKARLDLLAEKGNLHAFRTAILNFLFIYKQLIIYRRDFVPYDLQKAAHDLDSLMGPVLDAFNQDVDPYIDDQLHSLKIDERNAKGFVSSSSLQVAAISGTQAAVSGKVNNYFDITPPLSLADLLKAPDQNVKDALTKVLQPKEIMVVTALANLTGQPRITAEVGRGASLTITPVSLDGASSAALDVDFNVSEGSAPQSTESTPRKDLLDRVAEHKVTSHVRVESLKLFSASSFTMELQHPERGQPFPIIGQAWEAVFGQTPYLGRLFHFPNRLATVDNRSAAIVRAVVVPTAMDLGLGLPFEQDRVFDPAENATINLHSMDQMEEKPRLFHRDLMLCIEKAQSSNCLGGLTLSTTPADLK